MQSSFGRPYPSEIPQPRAIAAPRAQAASTSLVLIVTYAVASFAVLAFGLSQGA